MRQSSTFAERTLRFYQSLRIEEPLPCDIEVMNPFSNEETLQACRLFDEKFFNDNKKRRLILGINPGRFGAGVTGIPFTDPVRLETECGINNPFQKKPELSSQFVYMFINRMGGVQHFYRHYYIGAVSPLGFTKNGKNYNYYDSKALEKALKPFIVKNLVNQVALGIDPEKCFCLGQGKNFEYLQNLNKQIRLFKEIIPLPHPRWVMQYRRKETEKFLDLYAQKLSK